MYCSETTEYEIRVKTLIQSILLYATACQGIWWSLLTGGSLIRVKCDTESSNWSFLHHFWPVLSYHLWEVFVFYGRLYSFICIDNLYLNKNTGMNVAVLKLFELMMKPSVLLHFVIKYCLLYISSSHLCSHYYVRTWNLPAFVKYFTPLKGLYFWKAKQGISVTHLCLGSKEPKH